MIVVKKLSKNFGRIKAVAMSISRSNAEKS